MVTLAELCKQRGISVERLAAETGASASNIRSLLARQSTPRVELAVKIARYLDVPVESVDWSVIPKSDPAAA